MTTKNTGYQDNIIYEVRTEADDDGRTMKTLGFAIGDPGDIKAYYDNDKYYNLYLEERRVVHVTPDRVPERKLLRERQEQLEAELEEIRKKLSY